jgi:hypothetical protein
MAVSHNGRVLKALRDLGYVAQVVEHYDSYTRRRYDLFGVIDILAVGNGETVAVQVTSRGNMSSRRRKIREAPELPYMLGAGWRIELWGYDQPRGPRTAWRLKTESMDL